MSAHPMIDACERLVKQMLDEDLFFDWINMKRKLVIRRDRQILDNYIGDLLEERFATRHSRENQKMVIDLALADYLKEEQKMRDTHQLQTLDPTFKKVAVSQVKTFLFAGHETTN